MASPQDRQGYGLASDTFDHEEIDAALEVMRSGRYTAGERVAELEHRFADWIGASHAVMVNSGSSANLLAVEAMVRGTVPEGRRWPAGAEVLVPALSWPTTVWPIAQLGLVPVLVDVDPTTLAIDLDRAQALVTPNTVGMFLIHVLGYAAPLHQYLDFCGANNMTLLEDSCESLGAHSDSVHVGTAGTMGTFSTYFSHHMTTIEGGFVVTDDDRLADDLRGMRSHGWTRGRTDRADFAGRSPLVDDRFLFATTGYNLRSTDLAAAIGSIQLDKLPGMLDARTRLAGHVIERAAAIPWLEVVGADALAADEINDKGWRSHSWMNIPFRVDPAAGASRAEVVASLEADGVETRPVIAGNLAHHPAMASVAHRRAEDLSVSDAVFEHGFMIGCRPLVTDAEVTTLDRAIDNLTKLA